MRQQLPGQKIKFGVLLLPIFSRRGAVVKSVGAWPFQAVGPGFETTPTSSIWFDFRKGIRSIKCYTASFKSPFDWGHRPGPDKNGRRRR